MSEPVRPSARLAASGAFLALLLVLTAGGWAQNALLASGGADESPSVPEGSETAMIPGPTLAGTWAQMLVTTTSSRVPILGEVRSTTSALLLMNVSQDGDDLAITRQV